MVKITISYGELLDKLSILQIKKERIKDEEKLIYIKSEYNLLLEKSKKLFTTNELTELYNELLKTNNLLWDVENRIRELENYKIFEGEFIDLSRKVYLNNDNRFFIKNKINKIFDSKILEIKEYSKY